MTADILRKRFLDFFKARKHRIVESDSLIPRDDPTVLFTPAGMNQFKKEFLGFDSGFSRAATSQRCLRTDDLEKVGKTSCHHTFFEMLGNFSFGDYFKKEAIGWAWEFLTGELKISPEKLWVSVYREDEEAYKIWKETVKVPEQKIVKLGDKENFWPSEAKTKGPNGPCGPCSEIFFDFGPSVGCAKPDCSPACGCGRFVEVWNLVFTQFNRRDGGLIEPLPKKNIDTGMGLERLASVMQGKLSNFETELFSPIIQEITRGAGCRLEEGNKEALYAISDHIRAVVFSIYDGILPSNEGRGYIVRKVIRKSILHLRSLGVKTAFLNKLVPLVAKVMKEPYPELSRRQEDIAQVILSEEKAFINTLDSSSRLFKEKFSQIPQKQDAEACGRMAFQLYDTYGIPLELTQDWLKNNSYAFSQNAFELELNQQKERSKLLSGMKGDVFAAKDMGFGAKETKFLGYSALSAKARVQKIIKDGKEVKKISKGEEAQVILDKTPFYAESGGQVGDSGSIIKGKNLFAVDNTRKSGKVFLHSGSLKSGTLRKNDPVNAEVDSFRRLCTERNHTATHMLQAALRKVLGPHVQQQGSLVAPERLRFDFTHFKDVSKEELDRAEELVNNYILENVPLAVKQMPLSVAKRSGALAFFGEKYEGKVRVVSIGDFSQELCGGTHLASTGSIGLFKIVHEGSVASGVRRIEAVTGKEAYKAVKKEETLLDDIASALNIARDKCLDELQKRLNRARELERQLSSARQESLKSSVDSLLEKGEKIGAINLIVANNPDPDSCRKAVDLIKEKVKEAAVIYSTTGSNLKGQVFSVVGVTADLTDKGVDASWLIREIAPILGGSGGGRKDFAQAGGKNPEKEEEAFKRLKELIAAYGI